MAEGLALVAFLLLSVLDAVSSCNCRRTSPPPDRNPPNLQCPPPIVKENDPFQTHAVVHYSGPTTAYDPEDRRQHPVTASGLVSGSAFREGSSQVYFSASDSSGNVAKCSLDITVNVIRCPAPSYTKNGFVHCHPSSDFVKGAVCDFGCYEGYTLAGGVSRVTCLSSGQWSDPQPQCQRVECDPLPLPPLGYHLCTDGNFFLSACSLRCPPGFSVRPGLPSVHVCNMYGVWRGYSSVCQDSTPPKMEGCGLYVELVAGKGQEEVELKWTAPTVSDNSGEIITPILLSYPRPGTYARAGTYRVLYTARDSVGNEALPCEITVVVKVLMCPRQYPTPYLRTSCPYGVRYGAVCEHSCQGGWKLSGTSQSHCERSSTSPAYALWDWREGQPRCEKGRRCPDLPVPVNGALACDLWYGGEFCQMQCQSGTDFPRQLLRLKDINVCGSSGSWMIPVTSEPECLAVRRPGGTSTTVGLSFFTGDCYGEEAQRQIQENFISKLNSSLFSAVCLHSKCSAHNVEVKCGRVRLKRSTNSSQEASPVSEVTINFLLRSDLGNSSDKIAAYQEAVARSNALLATLGSDLDLFLSEVVGGNVSITGSRLQRGFPRPDCAPGSFPSYSELACIECSKGSYYDQSNESCVPCPVGSYQDREGQSSCEPCPPLHSTEGSGAVTLQQCLAQCGQGHWSSTGMEPCTPCPRGTLQPGFGAMSCLPCPANTATVEEGATGEGSCQEFDLAFPSGNAAIAELHLNESVAPEDTLTLTLWFQGSTEVEVAFLNLSLRQNDLLLSLTPDAMLKIIVNGHVVDDDVVFNASKWRHISLVLDDSHATLLLDGQPVLENVSCPQWGQGSHPSNNTEVGILLGGDGFKGSITQLHIWDGDVTLPNQTTPRCSQALVGNVLSWRQLLDATEKGSYVRIPSQCDDTDACLSDPCHAGTCSDVINGFTCTCHEGFAGALCDVNIDDCEGHLCENGGACVDGVMNYTCSCLSNYTGAFCDDVIRDGEWGDWGNWSQCSVTCGEGFWHRQRRCDSPLPQNGGLDCQGEATETASCNLTVCPECPEVVPPANGSWTCEDNVTLTRCHVGCDVGFDFDIEPMAEYICGLETGYKWGFQTEDNPLRRLSNCMPKTAPVFANVTWRANYVNLTCGETWPAEEVTRHVTAAMATITRNITCVQDNTCKLEEKTVTQCRTNDDRDKRSIQRAGVLIVLSILPRTVGGERSQASIEAALATLNASAQSGAFTVGMGGQFYPLDDTSTYIDALVHCAPGHAFIPHFCVPCGRGTYGMQDYCRLCDVGSFQSLPGQESCLPCPSGLSTAGRGSVSTQECTVRQTTTSTRSEAVSALLNLSLIVGAVTGCILALILVVFIVVMVVKKTQRSKGRVDPSIPMEWPEPAGLGPANSKLTL